MYYLMSTRNFSTVLGIRVTMKRYLFPIGSKVRPPISPQFQTKYNSTK